MLPRPIAALHYQKLINISQTISTITLTFPRLYPSTLAALEDWLRSILWESVLPLPHSTPVQLPFSVHRTKGRIPTTGSGVKMVQGVREVFEITDLVVGKEASSGQNEEGKLVLIGRGLDRDQFEISLKTALEAAQ